MIYTRKGLSDIVTNVLIILLVLVAVGIIWAFVKPAIDSGSRGIEGSKECLTVEVAPVSCVHSSPASTTYNVTYRRNAGSGKVQELRFIFKDASGNSKVVPMTTAANVPNEFESKLVTLIDVGAGTYTFNVASIVATSDPAGKTCPATTTEVACS